MFYDFGITGRLKTPPSGMCLFLAAAPPCFKGKLADIVERTIQTEPSEAAQFNACSQELGWDSRAALLFQSKWVGACACTCMHVSM